jgi:hypothetical protein
MRRVTERTTTLLARTVNMCIHSIELFIHTKANTQSKRAAMYEYANSTASDKTRTRANVIVNTCARAHTVI